MGNWKIEISAINVAWVLHLALFFCVFFFLVLSVFIFVLMLLLPTDINECISGEHDCHSLASCTNTERSFSCSCNYPYIGDGKSCIPKGKYSM